MIASLAIIALAPIVALGLGLRARAGHTMGLEQWTVGGRGFSSILVFLLLAGEIYTTFTLLGASGWAYGQGAPAYYIICYLTLGYILTYFMLPPVWLYAKENGLVSQPDYFARRYDSPALGILVSLVDVVALIPYLVLQLTGLGIIVTAAGYGVIPKQAAVWIGAAVVTAYVIVSGVRGSAWTAVLKDTAILVVVVSLGIYLPIHLYGGVGPMFEAIAREKPGFLTFPASGKSLSWFVSTTLLTAVGSFMWPHPFAASYTARNARVFRQNAILLPIYQLILLFVYFVGFAAVLNVPALKGSETDLALFTLVVKELPPWVVGIVGATGVLTALVPGSMVTMTTATLIARNLYGAARPRASEAEIVVLAKALVLPVMLIAVYLTLAGSSTIVTLLLVGYSFVTQMFPAVAATLLAREYVTKEGAFSGILAGVAVAAWLTFTHSSLGTLLPGLPQPVQDLNVGVVALAVNVAVLVAVSAATRTRLAVPAGER
jgi:SSS family solute:Na+ symporter